MEFDAVKFGGQLRRARETLGLSQEDLAIKVGKTQKSIIQFENGTRRMFVNDLPKFASALNVPLGYFFTGKLVPEEVDELITTEIHRLNDLDAKQSLLKLVRVFCDFAEAQE